MKWNTLKKIKLLKEVNDSKYKNIRMAADLTRKEREENARLREELKQKRERGGKWIIRRNRIIQVREEEDTY